MKIELSMVTMETGYFPCIATIETQMLDYVEPLYIGYLIGI